MAAFKQKPVTGRGEPALVYTPWTRSEFKNLTKDFPDPMQDPLGFAQEFDFIVRTYAQDIQIYISLCIF